ncbi:relaxase domain-containing protein [Rhizobium leguminosarum]|uniref:MobF family relaxase n=1 Tax=Rhizobium leguminosarum TaxID=384 RepID=UPI001C9737AE|nr:MobF family relaxase [Rhizobium leguminosarum]MBY5453970.1 relaxase domain-containing protein [Rhizobium leguminosarum]
MVMTITRASGIEGINYLANVQKHAANEQLKPGMAAALNPGAAEKITAYLDGSKSGTKDNGTHQKESAGRRLVLGEIPEPDLTKWEEKRKTKKGRKEPKPQKVESFGVSGEELPFDEALLMGEGHHPKTGKRLVQNNTKNKRTVGNDVQFGSPKSVSVLWANSAIAAYHGSERGLHVKTEIEASRAEAVKVALELAHKWGLLISRRSEAKHGHEGAGVVLFGQYDHFTNRKGEPHLHTHNMWFNLCVRADGTTGTVDNAQLVKYAAVIAAAYRMEEAAQLNARLGVRVSKVDRNYEIDGVPELAIDIMSTRRKDVIDYLEQMGIDNSAEHRAAAKYAAYNTRDDKSAQPSLTELYGRWEGQFAEIGMDFETMMKSVSEAAEKKEKSETEAWIAKNAEDALNGVDNDELTKPQFDLNEIKARAYASIVLANSAFTERKILKEVFEELQVFTNVATAEKVVDQLIQSGELIPLKVEKDDLFYTTAEIAQIEQRLINDARSMLSNVEIMDPRLVDEIVNAPLMNEDCSLMLLPDGKPAFLKDEQKAAVRRCCGADQITFVHGSAGAGKSKQAEKTAAIHRALGQEVHAIAPSHKAKEVVARDAQIELEMARAVAGFINGYEKGKFTLGPKSTMIVDEAGMIGLDDMAKLVAISKATKARLIFSGDKFQLPSIARGAPLALLSKPEICGAAYLQDIVRQKDPRQREASMLMAKGETSAGLQHYLDTRRVKFSDDAMEQTEVAYMADREENPNASRMIGVFRNAHATQLNLRIRANLKAEGAIAAEGVTFGTWTRGRNQRVVDREFCERERIIFGESFKIGDLEVSNNTTATIDKIEQREGREPLLTITTDTGLHFIATPSQMVGYRDKDAKDKTTPKIDYAACQTVYSLQGSTFDRMFVYAGEAGNAELAYVMMSRHKIDCQVFVDRQRIYDELASKAGAIYHLDKKTGAAPEEHSTPEAEPTEEEIRKQWIRENSVSGRKLNACDFHDSVEEFLARDFSTTGEKNKMQNEAKSEEVNVYAQGNKGRTEQPAAAPVVSRPPMPRGIGRITAPVEAKALGLEKPKTLGEQALDRLNNGKAGQAVARQKSAAELENERKSAMSARLKQESDFLNRGVNLVDYAMKHGAKIKKGTEKSYILNRSIGTEYTLTWGEGQGLVITQLNSGAWTFYDRAADVAGGIVTFYQMQNNLPVSTKQNPDKKSFKEAMDGLRKEFGLDARDLSNYSSSYSPRKVEPSLTGVALHESKLAEAKAYDAKKLEKVDRAWNMGLPIRNGPYSLDLLSRAISTTTQDGLAAQNILRVENPRWNDFENKGTRGKPVWETVPNKNEGGWLVAMRTAWNTLTGYIRKGPVGIEEGKRFSTNGPSSQRALVRYGNLDNPSRFVLDESISDSFTRYERENYRADTQYVATAGNPKDVEEAMVFDLARSHPGAEWALGKQADAANEKFRKTMTQAIKDGDETARIVTTDDLAPGFKDISEQHKSENADRIKADLEKFGLVEQQVRRPPTPPLPQQPTAQEKRRPPLPPRSQPSRWDRPVSDPEAAEAYRKRQQKEAEERQQQKSKGPTM